MALPGPNKPRIGIPWRTSQEELNHNLAKMRHYLDAVSRADAEPVPLSLRHPDALAEAMAHLDGFVLPGSQHDVNPAEYGTANCGKCEPPDLLREETDGAVLGYAFGEQKRPRIHFTRIVERLKRRGTDPFDVPKVEKLVGRNV